MTPSPSRSIRAPSTCPHALESRALWQRYPRPPHFAKIDPTVSQSEVSGGHTAAPRWRCAPQALQALAAGSRYVFSFLFEPPVLILRRLPVELTRVLRADAEHGLKRHVRIAVCEPDVLSRFLLTSGRSGGSNPRACPYWPCGGWRRGRPRAPQRSMRPLAAASAGGAAFRVFPRMICWLLDLILAGSSSIIATRIK